MSLIYLDNAATTYPKPESVYRAAEIAMREGGGNPGRGLHPLAKKSAEIVYQARENIASFFCGSPERVVFTKNATEALNIAIKGLCGTEGGHILISDLEHNSVLRPVIALSKKGFHYSTFSSCGSDLDILSCVERNLRADTRMVVVCHRSNVAPITLPISAIGKLCAARGICFVVDASQSAGSVEINMQKMHIDALCAPGHKGLLGLMGSGFVLFGKKVKPERIATLVEGGSGVDSLDPCMPIVLPERLEAGTLAVPAIASLSAGIDFLRAKGVQNICQKENTLMAKLYDMLSMTGKVNLYCPAHAREGTALLFNVCRKDPAMVASYLSDRGICVRDGLHCSPLAHKTLGSTKGAVRVSISPFTRIQELDGLRKAIREL